MRGPQIQTQTPNPVRDGGKGGCPIPPELNDMERRVNEVVSLVNEIIAPAVNDIYRKYIKDKVSIEDEHDVRVALEAMIADIVEKLVGVNVMIHENIGEYPALVIDIEDDFRISAAWLDVSDEISYYLYQSIATYEYFSESAFKEKLDELKKKGYYVREMTLLELRRPPSELKKTALWFTSDDLDEWDSEYKKYFIEVYD